MFNKRYCLVSKINFKRITFFLSLPYIIFNDILSQNIIDYKTCKAFRDGVNRLIISWFIGVILLSIVSIILIIDS